MPEPLLWIIFITVGFLSGSVLYAKIVPFLIKKKDVEKISDDGNPGTANAFIQGGVVVGILTLILELSKGIVPVLICSLTMDHTNMAFVAVVASPVLGHAVGVFNQFRGGKCIAVSFGVLLGAIPASWIPLAVLVVFYVLFSTVVTIAPNRIRSIVTYVATSLVGFPLTVLFGTLPMACACVVISCIAIVKHTRLFAKVENPEVWKVCVFGKIAFLKERQTQKEDFVQSEDFCDEQMQSYPQK